MKKHYTKLTIVIASLIFAAFMLTGAFFTYINASKVMDEYADHIESRVYFYTYNNEDEKITLNDLINNIYRKNWKDMSDLLGILKNGEGIGFYSCIEHQGKDGNVKKLGLDDFIMVSAYDKAESSDTPPENGWYTKIDAGYVPIEYRFIPVVNDLKYNPENSNWIWDFSFDGMVDDNFLYDGTVSGNISLGSKENVEFTVGRNEFVSDENAVSFSEWQKGKSLDCEYYPMADSKSKARLNNEAKELYESLADEIQITANPQSSIFTTSYKYVLYYGLDDGSAAYVTSVFVYHPLMITIKQHIFIYIMWLIMLAAIEMFVVFMMKKLYSNRMGYELMRQDLTRSIAHDLKTPLAITKAYTENWEYIDEEDRPEYAEKLNEEVDHMADMINNMLNMSKLDSQEKELSLEEVDLYKTASDIYEHMQPIIEERGLKASLVTDKEDGEYIVSADPKMIKIVMNNFISNAVKYAGSKVEIKLLSTDKKVMFMVSNNGVSIPKKDIKKIWEPFYRTDKARTDRISSHGMGLAICRSILKMHKAKYKCVSSHSYTSFWFELKRIK